MSKNSFIMRIAWMVTTAFISVNVKTGTLNELSASTTEKIYSDEYYEPATKVGLDKRWTNDPDLVESSGTGQKRSLKARTGYD